MPTVSPDNPPKASENAADCIGLQDIADSFVAKVIKPVWHRNARSVYSETLKREIEFEKCWQALDPEWIELVGACKEALLASKVPSYQARLGWLKNVLPMSLTKIIQTIPEYHQHAAIIPEFIQKLGIFLCRQRSFRQEHGFTIDSSISHWFAILSPGGWQQCYSLDVFAKGMDLEKNTSGRIAVGGYLLVSEIKPPIPKDAYLAMLAKERMIEKISIRLGNRVTKAQEILPAAIDEALEETLVIVPPPTPIQHPAQTPQEDETPEPPPF